MPINISVPGSKSITNRALLLAAIARKPLNVNNFAECDDTTFMISGLKELGFKIKENKKSKQIKISPKKSKNTEQIKIYTGNAGTTTRFLTAFGTLQNQQLTISGNQRMNQRPIKELTEALNNLGASVIITGECPPVTIMPTVPKGGSIKLPGNTSSQYLSALLMIAPALKKKTEINIVQSSCSKPYINMTISMLNQFGVKVMNKNFKQLIVNPQKFEPPKNYNVETDASSASYIGAYAALHPDTPVAIKNLSSTSLQGDIKFLRYLKKMGCKIAESKNNIIIQGPKALKSLKTVDMNDTPDLVMTFAILAMFTPDKTKISNIENLRIKETDRLEALKNEITKLGIKVKTTKDSIEIEGNPNYLLTQSLKPPIAKEEVTIKTYDDHRIAMSFGIINDLIPYLKIENPSCVSKSYSTFWADLKKLSNARKQHKK